MADFKIEIAGHVFIVHSLFESTRDYCRAYLTETAAEFDVTVTPEDLAFEQAQLYAEALEEGMRVRKFTDPFLERAAIQRKVAACLFAFDTLLFHGSTVAVDGQAYLFTAKCGTGKSTHTRLWREAFGDRAVMVNDDKPFLQIAEAGVTAWGAPWSGKHGLDTNIAAPLKGICILERGAENRIAPIPPAQALPMLQKQGNPPPDPADASRYWKLLDILAEKTPLWHMECTRDVSAALTAYAAMSQG